MNRPPNQNTGVSHGGVGIFYKNRIGNFKPISIPNPDNFEILPAIGSIRGSSRKLAIIAAYIPPNYTVPRGKKCLEHIESCILDIKRRFTDPFIIVAGDYNQWDALEALVEYRDMKEVPVGPTRGSREIDRFFCNIHRSVTESAVLPPLETED